MILAIDFDGTCVEDRFPLIGQEMPGCTQNIQSLIADGHQVFIWTCRRERFLDQVRSWFSARGITDIGFNESPVDKEFEPGIPRKAYADMYIDDRDPRGFPGWEQILTIIKERTDHEQ